MSHGTMSSWFVGSSAFIFNFRTRHPDRGLYTIVATPWLFSRQQPMESKRQLRVEGGGHAPDDGRLQMVGNVVCIQDLNMNTTWWWAIFPFHRFLEWWSRWSSRPGYESETSVAIQFPQFLSAVSHKSILRTSMVLFSSMNAWDQCRTLRVSEWLGYWV